MPTYKGNAGHLMQHWTLCKMLEVAACKGVTGLNLIDAYAMAPLATKNKCEDAKFKRAKNSLPNLGDSAVAYGQTWHQLTCGHCPPRKGYPNSAAFVERIWKGDFAMLLCEIEAKTCKDIEDWLTSVRQSTRCRTAKLHYGSWRCRFKQGLLSPTSMGLSDDALTLVLFDPYMYNRHRRKVKAGNLYPCDLEDAVCAMDGLYGNVLIQLSTYSAQDGNSQRDVVPSVSKILGASGFKLLEKMRVNGNMMSLVYARNVPWSTELANVLGGFDNWFSKI